MNKTKYKKQLKKAFIAWFEEKAEKIYDIGEDSQKYLSKNLGIKEDEFLNKYIKPITNLNNLQLIQFFKALSYHLADRFSPLPYVIKYQISQNMNPEPNALDWLLVHIKYIALFDFEDDISYECKKPYKQCIYCGALDKFKAPKCIKDKEFIEFDERKHFCHNEDCPTLSGSNPEEHNPFCHYAIFARRKKTLIDRIKKSHSAKTAVAIFIDFCEKQFKENLSIKYAIRTKEEYESGEYGYVDLTSLSNNLNFEDLFYSEEKIIEEELAKLKPLK